MAQGRLTELGRCIEGALSAVDRAAALTHRLLAFSRRQTLDPKPISVDQLVGSAWKTCFARRSAHRSSSRLSWPASYGRFCATPNQLENALLNLVINACDAMPDGGHLAIETANVVLDEKRWESRGEPLVSVPAAEYVALFVTDTGTSPTQ